MGSVTDKDVIEELKRQGVFDPTEEAEAQAELAMILKHEDSLKSFCHDCGSEIDDYGFCGCYCPFCHERLEGDSCSCSPDTDTEQMSLQIDTPTTDINPVTASLRMKYLRAMKPSDMTRSERKELKKLEKQERKTKALMKQGIKKCSACGADGHIWCNPAARTESKAPETKKMQLPGTPGYSGTGGYSGNYSYEKWKVCDHKPQEIMKSERGGWSVWAGKKFDCMPYLTDFDLIMNLSGYTAKESHDIPIPELKKWERFSKLPEIMLDWRDYGVVDLPLEFWTDLINYIKENKKKVLVFCVGGHGRTGTALAALFIAQGWSANSAMKWIWDNYCKEAIESKEQMNYLERLERERQAKNS